ncbi:MAG: cobyrinate a,c-diamide synthase [Deltaproteobacteria bacterium]|nr:cobyrinate a,c-diamide synthase [Deltaproteobacteria bacterium]
MIISALRGGSGKTILSIGIIGAWKQQGKTVIPFKKGPDYIDAGWLALAAGQPCYNLDSFLLNQTQLLKSFIRHATPSGISVVEGNRGLYDGIDMKGSTSTAELAKLLGLPVILCLDCTKSTRTMAAVLLGCLHFDADVPIQGVVLNRVAGSRHEQILRSSIEYHCGIPVIGAIPAMDSQFPERHMGLVPTPEHDWAAGSVDAVSRVVKACLDLDRLEEIAHQALPINAPVSSSFEKPEPMSAEKPRIGIIRDSAFQFYYPENIEALSLQGAELVFLSPLTQQHLPDLDALYIGGGFPETHARILAENTSFRSDLKKLAEEGLPIYAECGGLMYLGKEIVLEDGAYPMVGVLPVVFGLSPKPKGHGYTMVTVDGENPFYPEGMEIRGHEFHYSWVASFEETAGCRLVFSMKRGTGFLNHRDGVCYKNILATYTHIHASGTPEWASALIRNAVKFRRLKGNSL